MSPKCRCKHGDTDSTMASVKDKVVLITGGSSGIGAGIATYLAPLGVKLSLIGRNKDNLDDVSKKCQSEGLSKDNVLTVTADINNDDDVRRMLKTTVDTFGRLDVLVNNAGIGHYKTVEETDMERFDLLMKTNVRAPFYICQQAKQYLIESKGSVINISSILAQRGMPGSTAYCMSKAALDHLTRIFAMEMAPHDVRVNAVSPGFTVNTQIQIRGGLPQPSLDKYQERHRASIPLGRAGDAEDVARVVKFLASEDAEFITGQVILVDGGKSVAAANFTRNIK